MMNKLFCHITICFPDLICLIGADVHTSIRIRESVVLVTFSSFNPECQPTPFLFRQFQFNVHTEIIGLISSKGEIQILFIHFLLPEPE